MFRSHTNLLLCALIIFCDDAMSVQPRDVVIVASSRGVQLDCSGVSNCESSWTKNKDSSGYDTLFWGEKRRVADDSYNITADCNLYINKVTLRHAGVYQCDKEVYAVSVIDDGYPNITLNASRYVLADEVIALTCTMQYNGTNNLKPSLHFNIAGEAQVDPEKERVMSTIVPQPSEVKMMEIKITGFIKVTPDISRSEVTCSTDFENLKDVVGRTHLPEVHSPFRPTNISVHRNGVAFQCEAEGLPAPVYYWIQMDNNETIFTSNLLTCDDSLSGLSFVCNATNVKGSSLSSSILCEKPAIASQMVILIVAVLIGVFALVVIVFVVFWYKRRSVIHEKASISESAVSFNQFNRSKPSNSNRPERNTDRASMVNSSAPPDVIQSDVVYAELQDVRQCTPQKPKRGEQRQLNESVYSAVRKA